MMFFSLSKIRSVHVCPMVTVTGFGVINLNLRSITSVICIIYGNPLFTFATRDL